MLQSTLSISICKSRAAQEQQLQMHFQTACNAFSLPYLWLTEAEKKADFQNKFFFFSLFDYIIIFVLMI